LGRQSVTAVEKDFLRNEEMQMGQD
jgi:hypothetical protein